MLIGSRVLTCPCFNNALLGGGVRVRVWIREQRKIKRRSKILLSLCWQSWTSLTLLGCNVAKACTRPRNLTRFTRPFLLVRGWGLGTRLIINYTGRPEDSINANQTIGISTAGLCMVHYGIAVLICMSE